MAGRRGGARGLILGLALIAVGAALSQMSVAEPLTRSGEQATPSKPSLFFGKARQRAKANPAQEVAASRARAADTSCASPWTYSRGLRRCACTRDGYSLQSGDCLLDAATSCGDNEHWSPKRSACVCAEGLKRIGGTCAPDETVTAVADPVATLPNAGRAHRRAGSGHLARAEMPDRTRLLQGTDRRQARQRDLDRLLELQARQRACRAEGSHCRNACSRRWPSSARTWTRPHGASRPSPRRKPS